MAVVQPPPKWNNRHERFVERQLRRASQRVRLLDVAQGALGAITVVLCYGLAMILLDRWLQFPQWIRQAGFVVLMVGLGVYLWRALVTPLVKAVNPYYAALQVEQTIPESKNSLVNWLDLHDDEIAPGVKAALGQRAAEDLKHADLDQAIQSHNLWRLGVALFLLTTGFLACLFFFRVDQFQSLLARTFQPFGGDSPLVKQTRITIIEPTDGNATVGTHQSVRIRIHVDGRIPTPGRPDAPRLLLRYSENEPFEARPLEPLPDAREEWSIVLTPNVVRTGFWYKVVGGDDETPEYRVQVRASPSVIRFDLLHRYRPYLRWEPRRTDNPNIEDYRGTEVEIQALTNRPVGEGRMVIESEGQIKTIPAAIHREEPETLRFRIVLEKDAKYRIYFTTLDGESNKDPAAYTIRVLGDAVPQVEFTKPQLLEQPEPQADLTIPADGLLRLEGLARDDFGLTNVTLYLSLDGVELRPQVYLAPRHYVLETGGYVRSLEYKDDVDLLQIQLPNGQKVEPKPDQVLEFWLEARDNCDFPGPQIGKTRKYRVKIAPARLDDKQLPRSEQEKQEQAAKRQERDNERKIAAEEKREHELQHERDRQQQSAKDRQELEERRQSDGSNPNQASEPKTAAQKGDGPREQQQQGSEKSTNDPKQEDPQAQPDSSPIDPTAEKIEKIKQELLKENQSSDSQSPEQNQPDQTQGGSASKAEKTQSKGDPKPSNQPTQESGKNETGQSASALKADTSQAKNEPSNGEGEPSTGKSTDGKKLERSAEEQSDNKTRRSDKEAADGSSRGSEEANIEDRANDNKAQSRSSTESRTNSNAKGNRSKTVGEQNKPADSVSEKNPANSAKSEGTDRKPDSQRTSQPPNKSASDAHPSTRPDMEPGKAGADVGDKSASEQKAGQSPQAENASEQNQQPMNAANEPSGSKSCQDAARQDRSQRNSSNKSQDGNSPMSSAGQQHDAGNENLTGGKERAAPKQQEIDRLAEEAMKQDGDGKGREEARQKLSEIAENDANPENRRAAQEALRQCENCNNQGNGAAAPNAASGSKNSGQESASGKPLGQAPRADGKAADAGREHAGNSGNDRMQSSVDAAAKSANQEGTSQQTGQSGRSQEGAKQSNNEKQPGSKNDGGSKGNRDSGLESTGQTPSAGKKSGERDNNASVNSDPATNNNEKRPANSGDPKAGEKASDMSEPQNSPMFQSGVQRGNGKNPKDLAEPGAGGNQPGFGNQERPTPASGDSAPQSVIPTERNEEFLRRSGDLNLEKVDPKKLRELFKKYNLSEEEYKDWLNRQAAKDDAKRQGKKPNDFQAADRKGSVLNTGVRRVESSQDPNAAKLYSGNTGQAPPEYRKAAERFAELLAKPPEPRPR